MPRPIPAASSPFSNPSRPARSSPAPGCGRSKSSEDQMKAKILVHPLAVRITHWLNALAMFIMIGSGWRIWNSDPIFPLYFPIELTLGGDLNASQDIHNELGLAGALQWHFAGMWLLTFNG